jgi:hypothetical protein
MDAVPAVVNQDTMSEGSPDGLDSDADGSGGSIGPRGSPAITSHGIIHGAAGERWLRKKKTGLLKWTIEPSAQAVDHFLRPPWTEAKQLSQSTTPTCPIACAY